MITAYKTLQKYAIICVSKTYLDSSVNENFLLTPGYHLLRADIPDNLRKETVSLYFKENLSLNQIENPYFLIGTLCVSHWLPRHSFTEYDDFLVNFEKLLRHSRQLESSFLLNDFKTRSKSWCREDMTFHEGTQIESLKMSYGFQQLISNPTHFLPNF